MVKWSNCNILVVSKTIYQLFSKLIFKNLRNLHPVIFYCKTVVQISWRATNFFQYLGRPTHAIRGFALRGFDYPRIFLCQKLSIRGISLDYPQIFIHFVSKNKTFLTNRQRSLVIRGFGIRGTFQAYASTHTKGVSNFYPTIELDAQNCELRGLN